MLDKINIFKNKKIEPIIKKLINFYSSLFLISSIATSFNKKKVAKLLIDNGAIVNEKENRGLTPLILGNYQIKSNQIKSNLVEIK